MKFTVPAVIIYVNSVPHFFFHWTEEIVEHLAEHGVSKDEFEAIAQDSNAKADVSRSSGLQVRVGLAHDGRLLICVFRWVDREQTEIGPITAYEID